MYVHLGREILLKFEQEDRVLLLQWDGGMLFQTGPGGTVVLVGQVKRAQVSLKRNESKRA